MLDAMVPLSARSFCDRPKQLLDGTIPQAAYGVVARKGRAMPASVQWETVDVRFHSLCVRHSTLANLPKCCVQGPSLVLPKF